MGGFNMSDRERGMRFAVEEIFYEAPLGVSYAMRTVPDAERAKVHTTALAMLSRNTRIVPVPFFRLLW